MSTHGNRLHSDSVGNTGPTDSEELQRVLDRFMRLSRVAFAERGDGPNLIIDPRRGYFLDSRGTTLDDDTNLTPEKDVTAEAE